MIRILGTVFAALLGLAFGSFLNVCLSRWPEGESVVTPRSHCRACGRTLAWWENVPLLSWLALRGRCRTCGVWIGWRYPLVELAVGGLWASAFAWLFLGSEHLNRGAPCADLQRSACILSLICSVGSWWHSPYSMRNISGCRTRSRSPGIALGFLFSLLQFRLNSTDVLAYFGATQIQGQIRLALC